MNTEFVSMKNVVPYATEYLKELYDIEDYHLAALSSEDEFFKKTFLEKIKLRGCTNRSRKVIILPSVELTLDNPVKASLKKMDNSNYYSMIIYFYSGFFTNKGLAKMFEIAEQYVWHEATHLTRMDLFGSDESHESDIDDLEYLASESELNAFAIQSLSTSDDIDLAMETYECCALGEVLETFKTIRNNLKHGISVEEEKPLEESTLKEAKSPKCWNLSSPNVTAKDIKNYVKDLPDDLSVVIIDDKGYSHSLGAIEAGNDYLVIHTSCANVEDFKKYLVK